MQFFQVFGTILSLLSSLGECAEISNWGDAKLQITDLQKGDKTYGLTPYSQTSITTVEGCHVAKVEGSTLDGWKVRRDGIIGKRYDHIDIPVFSKNGRALGYVVREKGVQFVVLNDREGPPFSMIQPETLALSQNGEHHAYIAWKSHWVLVVDGKVFESEDWVIDKFRPAISPDGSRVACVAKNLRTRRLCVLVNGVRGEYYEAIDPRGLFFSPDGSRLAYGAGEGGYWFRVVDGVRGQGFPGMGIDFAFGPDSKRTACSSRLDGITRAVFLDGNPVVRSEAILDSSFAFSPDGKRFACVIGKLNGPVHLFLDGKAGSEYTSIDSGQRNPDFLDQTAVLFSDPRSGPILTQFGIKFSPDGRRVAYLARQNGKALLVVDGKGIDGYDGVGQFSFSLDSEHFAFTVSKGGRSVLVLDGHERAGYPSIPAGPVFRSDGTLEFLFADAGKSLYRAEVTGY